MNHFPMAQKLTEFESASLHERGKILTGRFRHFCNDWDGLTVDETCIEADSCHDCDYDFKARQEIAKAVADFEATDPFNGRNTD